jgi:hypothetical protein
MSTRPWAKLERMTKRHSSLTGSWSGAYRYRGDAAPEAVFNAQIEEVGGAFVGSLQEPNTFLDSAGSVLTAEIEGTRDGSRVSFTKFYNHGGIDYAIRYDGSVDNALARINGKWTIPRHIRHVLHDTRRHRRRRGRRTRSRSPDRNAPLALILKRRHRPRRERLRQIFRDLIRINRRALLQEARHTFLRIARLPA